MPKADTRVVDVEVRDRMTMILVSDGRALCWGFEAGACGFPYEGVPLKVPAVITAADCLVAIAPGGWSMSAGIRADGRVMTWGPETHWEAGDGPAAGPGLGRAHVLPRFGARIERVNAGAVSMFVLAETGELFWWGAVLRDMGSDVPVSYPAPTPVIDLDDSGATVCFVGTAGDVYCFGGNAMGDLGRSPRLVARSKPIKVGLPGRAIGVRTYWNVSGWACAVLENGEVWCWGANSSSRLGKTQEELPWSPPVRIEGLPPILDADVGAAGCALDGANKVYCWGLARVFIDPSLGDEEVYPPVPWHHELDVKKVTVGEEHVCALTLDDRVFCAGADSGVPLAIEGFPDIQGALERDDLRDLKRAIHDF